MLDHKVYGFGTLLNINLLEEETIDFVKTDHLSYALIQSWCFENFNG
jgi:hypothetical protein